MSSRRVCVRTGVVCCVLYRLAVDFIQSSMGAGVKVLTTRGSLLQTLSFTAEATHKVSRLTSCHRNFSPSPPSVAQASNDDLILQSTLSLHCRVDSTPSSPPPPQLHTVILLTDDRNLRVKAHAAHLPVKDIPQFIEISRLDH